MTLISPNLWNNQTTCLEKSNLGFGITKVPAPRNSPPTSFVKPPITHKGDALFILDANVRFFANKICVYQK